jgi:hypothetical protein
MISFPSSTPLVQLLQVRSQTAATKVRPLIFIDWGDRGFT